MKALLDAHALLWFLSGSSRLSAPALACIQNVQNTLFVSPATLWEISIKDALGKLHLPQPFDELFPSRLEASGILILPILMPHLQQHRRLPAIITIPLSAWSSPRHWQKTSHSSRVIPPSPLTA